MSPGEGWGERISRAILLYAAANGRTSLARVGELVAHFEGRERPYAPSTVTEWTTEKNEPTLSAFTAMGEVFDCDPWWLAWGVGREPHNPVAKSTEMVPRSRGAPQAKRGGRR